MDGKKSKLTQILLAAFGATYAVCIESTLASSHTFIEVDQACSPTEKWSTGPGASGVDSHWIRAFSSDLQGKSSPIIGFSHALALKKQAKQPQEKIFSEYWISRNLLASGMVHLAESGFHAILAQETSDISRPFQLATLECLNHIRAQHAVFSPTPQWSQRLTALAQSLPADSRFQPIVWESVIHLISAQIGDPSLRLNTQSLLKFLRPATPHHALAQGLIAVQKILANERQVAQIQDLHQAVRNFELYLAKTPDFENTDPSANFLNSYRNHVYLLLGRTYYNLGNYAKAAENYRKVGVRSNESVHALTELSWAHLMREEYAQSIQTGIGLQTGIMKKTFCPDSLLVTAMALNEMCYFPEALKIVQNFKRDYEPARTWLKRASKHAGASQDNALSYKLAVGYLRNPGKSQVPSIIASEWVRSPSFIANQEAINLLLREKNTSDALSSMASKEQRSLASDLTKQIRELKEATGSPAHRICNRIVSAANHYRDDLKSLKEKLRLRRRVKEAIPVLKRMLVKFKSASTEKSRVAVSNIARTIASINQRMLKQLNNVAANQELLEIEILDGASEDIVWQNAHPDFKRRDIASISDLASPLGALNGKGEAWADEIPKANPDLPDNCRNKAKYLAIRHTSSF